MSAPYHITHQRLKELLRYSEDSGAFQWLIRPGKKMRIGQEAGSRTSNGYVQIKLDKRRYLAHRLAWLYVHGVWPVGEIDHINGVKTDNRIENLRDTSHAINGQNKRGPLAKSRVRMLGVTMARGKFQAQIKVGGKYHYLGVFDDAQAAHAAYLDAKRLLHPGCTI